MLSQYANASVDRAGFVLLVWFMVVSKSGEKLVAKAHRAGLMTDVTAPPLVWSDHLTHRHGRGTVKREFRKSHGQVLAVSGHGYAAELCRRVEGSEQRQRLDHSIRSAAVEYGLRQYTADRLKVKP